MHAAAIIRRPSLRPDESQPGGSRGSVSQTSAPPPSRLAACASPPWARATVCTIASPRPLPPSRLLDEARLKRSKARAEELLREPLARGRSTWISTAPSPAPARERRSCRRRSAGRCRPCCRSPGRGAAGRRRARAPAAPSTSISRPPPRPGGRSGGRRRRGPPPARRGARRSGSSPRSVWAIVSRSSESWVSRSVSSAAEASAARSSSGERPFASASSSSVRRIASGVRSSWLASATKARSCSSASPSRSSISFSVVPSRATSSSGRRHRQALVGLGGRDLRRPRAHRLDRLQRRRGHAVGGERGEQQRDRPADQQQLREVGERLVARLGRGADDDDLLLPPRVRPGPRAGATRPAGPAAGRGRGRSARAGPARSSAGVEQDVAADRQRGVGDAAAGVEHLGEALAAADQVLATLAQARVGLLDQGGDVAGPRAQAGVDRRVELGGEAQVDEDAGRAEDQRHHRGEDEGDPEADREAAQRPPSFRSR